MPGNNRRCFINCACWLRLKIYRSLGRVKMDHCRVKMNHCKPLLAGVSLPWEAISAVQECDPGGLGLDALTGKHILYIS